jgi:DeoR/GlpR family transcriptional regulator of sugar metabolism
MDHAERRSQKRHRVLKGAIIRFNKGYGAFECVVRNLSENGAKLTFGETSAVPAAFELKIAGGVVRGSDGGIVGEAAVDFIKQFKVDYAVIGTSAIDHDGALLDFDFREVKVAQAIIANARHVILVSDSTKFERTAPVRIGHLSQVNTFITDRCDIAAIRRICEDADVRLIETAREEAMAG